MQIIDVEYQLNGTLTKRNSTDLIVLHHAEASNCTAQQINIWHLENGWVCIGYHFFIRKDGTIYRGRPEWAVGAHAQGYNNHSLGICFEGRYTIETMPEAQIKAGQELVGYLRNKYGITNIKRHCEVNNTDCPGKNLMFDEIVRSRENLVLAFQMAAIADGFQLPKYGADGKFGPETESIMNRCVVKRRLIHKYPNATKLVQRLLNVEQDGKCGPITAGAIKVFQQINGLNPDSSCGPLTWKKLLGIN